MFSKPSNRETPRADNGLAPIWVLVITGIALLGNLNALSAGFVWDDGTLIVDNVLIKHWNTLPALFTQTFLASYYRPIVMLSFALASALWGLTPVGFHLTNLVLHAANCLLVFAIIRRVSANHGGALLSALLFAVHPVHKGVVNIADRTGILSAFFFLGALLLYMAYRETASRGRARAKYLCALACFALALLSKEEALMLPFVIIMVDLFLFPGVIRDRGIVVAAPYIPFFAIVGLFLFVRASVLEPMSGMLGVFAVEPVRRLVTIPRILLDYLFLLVFPFRLDLDPRTPLATSLAELRIWGSAVVMLSFAAAIPWLVARFKPVAFGMLWFLIVFIPMSNIIPIFPDLADTALFTPIHFLYLPSIGIFLCCGCGLNGMLHHFGTEESKRLHRKAVMLGFVFLLLAFSFLSIKRNTIWKENIRFFEYVVRMHPEDPGMHGNLGVAYLDAGRIDDAVREYELAIALDPEKAESYNGLGVVFLEMGFPDKAIEAFKKSIQLKPDKSGAYENLAIVYVQKGRLREAIAAGEKAVEIDPTNSQTRTNLGLIYMHADMLSAAEKQFLLALASNPYDYETYNALGALYAKQGDYGRARRHWGKALSICPDYQQARENLDGLDNMSRRQR